MDPNGVREQILSSRAWVRLVFGEPGVGKTYLGCQIAEYELLNAAGRLRPDQNVLFLTFARNAVARIRETFLRQIETAAIENPNRQLSRAAAFRDHVRLDTFAGFFWWLVGAYGRYAPGGTMKRPWLLGTSEAGQAYVPSGHCGYTFDSLEETALAVLNVDAVRALVSDVYPLVIVDEHQDVHPRLQEIIDLLSEGSRVVLLRGPGQCVYSGLKGFDPDSVLESARHALKPREFTIRALGGTRQRLNDELENLLRQYNSGESMQWGGNSIARKLVARRTRNDQPNELETHAGMELRDLREHLRKQCPSKRPAVVVLASTNAGVIALHGKLTTGSPSFKLKPINAHPMVDDALMLQYGRLMLELLPVHWVASHKGEVDVARTTAAIASLMATQGRDSDRPPADWLPLAEALRSLVGARRRPSRGSLAPIQKLTQDLGKVNKLLRATKRKLPDGSPPTPFTKSDNPLLGVLRDTFIASLQSMLESTGRVMLSEARRCFEASMQQRVLFEKRGILPSVQVMTIHKAKGREFDGVILVLEDDPKAIWRAGNRASEEETEDLYRVALSRARHAIRLVGFEDTADAAKPVIRRLLA